jgi:hypothetical protein
MIIISAKVRVFEAFFPKLNANFLENKKSGTQSSLCVPLFKD